MLSFLSTGKTRWLKPLGLSYKFLVWSSRLGLWEYGQHCERSSMQRYLDIASAVSSWAESITVVLCSCSMLTCLWFSEASAINLAVTLVLWESYLCTAHRGDLCPLASRQFIHPWQSITLSEETCSAAISYHFLHTTFYWSCQHRVLIDSFISNVSSLLYSLQTWERIKEESLWELNK